MIANALKYQKDDLKELQNILFISRSFYPENSPRALRATELVKEFARQGHKVTLLTVRDAVYHDQFEEEFNITIKDLGELRLSKINFTESRGIKRLFKRGLRRGMKLLFEYPDIELMFKVNKALQKETGYDLMISIAVPYPIHWGVAMARKKDHKIADVWVADCGDPYCGLENDSFTKPFYFAYIEKWFSRKADYISIPFEGARAAYFSEFHSKIKIIPQGLSFPEKTDDSTPTHKEKTTFAYFGNIKSYLHYAVPFLEKLNTVERDFRFIIYTRARSLFEQTLNKKTLEKCEVRDYVERDELLQELSGVDFLIHFPYLKDTQRSLKLIDYSYLDKPVLSYKNDENSDQVFQEFMNGDFKNKMGLGDHSKYKIENVAAQFLQLNHKELQVLAS